MKNYTVWVILAVSISVVLFCGQRVEADGEGGGVEQLSWLNGSWSGEFGGGMFYEHWKTVSADMMVGEGYMVMGIDTVESEVLTIQKVGRHLVYIASINGGMPTMFTLGKVDGNSWTFENPEHDFPQRVAYTRRENGELYIVVDGKMKGKREELVFTLKKGAM